MRALRSSWTKFRNIHEDSERWGEWLVCSSVCVGVLLLGERHETLHTTFWGLSPLSCTAPASLCTVLHIQSLLNLDFYWILNTNVRYVEFLISCQSLYKRSSPDWWRASQSVAREASWSRWLYKYSYITESHSDRRHTPLPTAIRPHTPAGFLFMLVNIKHFFTHVSHLL